MSREPFLGKPFSAQDVVVGSYLVKEGFKVAVVAPDWCKIAQGFLSDVDSNSRASVGAIQDLEGFFISFSRCAKSVYLGKGLSLQDRPE